jgi:ketosteroid isomerase-like protein
MKHLHILICLLIFTGCLQASEATVTSSNAFIKKWAESFNQNDSEKISSFYDKNESVDMLVSVGLWNQGHKAISDSYKRDMEEVRFYDSSVTKLNTRVYDKTALISFIHTFKYHLIEDNSHWRIYIRTTATLKHNKDGWSIVMEHSSPIKGIERATKIPNPNKKENKSQ